MQHSECVCVCVRVWLHADKPQRMPLRVTKKEGFSPAERSKVQLSTLHGNNGAVVQTEPSAALGTLANQLIRRQGALSGKEGAVRGGVSVRACDRRAQALGLFGNSCAHSGCRDTAGQGSTLGLFVFTRY